MEIVSADHRIIPHSGRKIMEICQVRREPTNADCRASPTSKISDVVHRKTLWYFPVATAGVFSIFPSRQFIAKYTVNLYSMSSWIFFCRLLHANTRWSWLLSFSRVNLYGKYRFLSINFLAWKKTQMCGSSAYERVQGLDTHVLLFHRTRRLQSRFKVFFGLVAIRGQLS